MYPSYLRLVQIDMKHTYLAQLFNLCATYVELEQVFSF